jgi:hypothetical protein
MLIRRDFQEWEKKWTAVEGKFLQEVVTKEVDGRTLEVPVYMTATEEGIPLDEEVMFPSVSSDEVAASDDQKGIYVNMLTY